MKVKDFNLKQTLECGQCFNFEKRYASESDKISDCSYEYSVTAFGRHIIVSQEKDELTFQGVSCEDIKNIWIPYFDLERDYGIIKKAVIEADPALKPVLEQYYGIRILNQEFSEILMSFIISQNKNIPQIKKLIKSISENYGTVISDGCYVFPDLTRLNEITEEKFRELKTGFRAPYLRDAIDRMVDGRIKESELKAMSFAEAKAKLMEIKGVGDKVANCVLLFGLGFRNAFPVDVWIKRIMEELYFHKDTDKKVIEEFAAQKFGEYGGYAQQYLFIYAKNK